jgi:hypothetical protein
MPNWAGRGDAEAYLSGDVLDQEDVLNVIDHLTYKPGSEVSTYLAVDGWNMMLTIKVPNRDDLSETVDIGRSVLINRTFRDAREVIRWVGTQIDSLELHERHEWLMYDGERIFDPHSKVGHPIMIPAKKQVVSER